MKISTINYIVICEIDPELGGYSVSVPELPGCYSQGETFESALANIREAIELYRETVISSQENIQSPIITTVPIYA